MKTFRLEPVVWLTTAAVVVGAALEADRQLHILPTSWGHWLAFVALALGLIVAGVKTRGSVTPTAAPKDNAGTPLVPVTMQAPDLPAASRATWEPKHIAGGPS